MLNSVKTNEIKEIKELITHTCIRFILIFVIVDGLVVIVVVVVVVMNEIKQLNEIKQ